MSPSAARCIRKSRDLPGRMNHRMPRLENGEIHPDPAVVFADRHDVNLVPGGAFARLLGCETIRVNSLHGQGILEPGKRVVVEGVAEDGTIEAIRIADAPGFAPRCAVACRTRSGAQSDQSRPVSGVRRSADDAPAARVARALAGGVDSRAGWMLLSRLVHFLHLHAAAFQQHDLVEELHQRVDGFDRGRRGIGQPGHFQN